MSSVGEPCLNSEGTLFMSLAAGVKHRPMKNVLCAFAVCSPGMYLVLSCELSEDKGHIWSPGPSSQWLLEE